jgi:hypothetical protein
MKGIKKLATIAAGVSAFAVPATGVSAAELESTVPETIPEDVQVTQNKVSYGQAENLDDAQAELDSTSEVLEDATIDLENAQESFDQADQNVTDAETAVDDAIAAEENAAQEAEDAFQMICLDKKVNDYLPNYCTINISFFNCSS